jgi:hypothetical protein
MCSFQKEMNRSGDQLKGYKVVCEQEEGLSCGVFSSIQTDSKLLKREHFSGLDNEQFREGLGHDRMPIVGTHEETWGAY